MKELAFVLALIFVIAVVLSIRAIALRIRQARAPYIVEKHLTSGKGVVRVCLQKGTQIEVFGEVPLTDPQFEYKLYEMEAEAREHAMALNMK